MIKINNYYKSFYYACLILAIILFISSVKIAGITIDEVGIKSMINVHCRAGFNGVSLENTPGDLIYYGIIHLLPGYLISRTVLLLHNFGTANQQVFFIIMHTSFFIMGCFTTLFLYRLLLLLKINKPIALCSAGLLLLYPTWLGSSFFNFKDISAGFFFTMYTYYTSRYVILKKTDIDYKLAISAALLCGIKIAFVPVIAVNYLYVLISSHRYSEKSHRHNKKSGNYNNDSTRKNSFTITANIATILLLSLLFTYVITPGAWHSPLTYLINDIKLMSNHSWDSCTTIMGEYIRVHSSEWKALIEKHMIILQELNLSRLLISIALSLLQHSHILISKVFI